MSADGRRVRSVDRILAALRTGPRTNLQLAEITPRYGARIYDLRRLGHDIATANGDGAVTTYTLNERSNA